MRRFSSTLLQGRLVFGKYPTDEESHLIVAMGYDMVVNLCTAEEITWTPYVLPSHVKYLSCPIPDRKPVGDLMQYKAVIDSILDHLGQIREDGSQQQVYIHCRGGHGRSGTLAAVIYGLVTNCGGQNALTTIRYAHTQRIEMSDKMRKLGAPQTAVQKRFVIKTLLR